MKRKQKIPKITYHFIKSKEGEKILNETYNMLFETVLKNRGRKLRKKNPRSIK